jgi:hypothetical protein
LQLCKVLVIDAIAGAKTVSKSVDLRTAYLRHPRP